MHLFAMGMLLMVLTHLLLVLPASARVKSVLVAVTFATALLNELSNWLVRFIHAGFAYVKVASFLAMEVSLLALIVILARHLWPSQGRAKRSSPPAHRGVEDLVLPRDRGAE
jgi:hypothetical protein